MGAEQSDSHYERPWYVESPVECSFYHTMDVPGFGVCQGQWDLRETVAEYLSHYKFAGKRVLDLGASSGMLSFYMEGQGAEVVSFDALRWDALPHVSVSVEELCQIKRSYWLSHRLRGSKAKVFYGNIQCLPDWLGHFDLAVFGSILLHLENPFGALKSAARLANEILTVEAHRPYLQTEHMVFRPAFPQNDYVWWHIPDQSLSKILHTLGYPVQTVRYLQATGPGNAVDLYSMLAVKALRRS